jgi:predicted  nucleic acid-binding Zn-ribbon protein
MSFSFSLQDEMSISQRLKSTLESEVQRAEERISRYDEEKKEMQKLLQEEKKKVEESEKNLNLLKETMMLMDEQLQVLLNLAFINCCSLLFEFLFVGFR